MYLVFFILLQYKLLIEDAEISVFSKVCVFVNVFRNGSIVTEDNKAQLVAAEINKGI